VFGIDSSELLAIVVVALLVIGPKDLPRVLYHIGKMVGQARGMARHFRTGFDAMIREAELEELQKQWEKDNARIMAENPIDQIASEMKPLADEVTGVLSAPVMDPEPEIQPEMSRLEFRASAKVESVPQAPVAFDAAPNGAPPESALPAPGAEPAMPAPPEAGPADTGKAA
jgi:sec-independent protein translocase protein TatB